MNTVMSSQNVTTNTNIVMASTRKLRNVKPSLTNSIAILHVFDAQNGRSPPYSSIPARQSSPWGLSGYHRRKTEKRVPKEMIGRRLSQGEAKRLLAKLE